MNHEKTILVIDDDLDFQFMIGNMLRMSGYKVRSLLEGKVNRVLEVARESDIVLLDVELSGVNGVEVGKALRVSLDTLDIPIILLSGNGEIDRIFFESKATTYMEKPFSLSELLNKIKELLQMKSSVNRGSKFIGKQDSL